MKKKLFTIAITVFLIILFIVGCADNATQISLDEIHSRIIDNALPPLKTKGEEFETLPPGEPDPPEYMERAPQDLVGEKLDISLTLDLDTAGTLLYRYSADKAELAIMYSNSNRGFIAMILNTEYENMGEFLEQSEVWSGTVSSVGIIDGMLFMYSRNSIDAEEALIASETSTICYGIITAEQAVAFDGEQYGGNRLGNSFDRALTHHGME